MILEHTPRTMPRAQQKQKGNDSVFMAHNAKQPLHAAGVIRTQPQGQLPDADMQESQSLSSGSCTLAANKTHSHMRARRVDVSGE